MNTEFLIGTILTVLFGIPSLIQLTKESPSRLILVVDELIDLYADITKSIDDLEVTYKGEKVNKNLFLIKAYVFYIGNKDVLKDQIAKPLFIELKEDSKWKDYRIIYKTDDLDIKIYQNDNRLTFDFELLKSGDFFCFQFLCEIKEKEKSVSKIFSASHRIANLGKVQYLDPKVNFTPISLILFSWFVTFVASFIILPSIVKVKESDSYDFKKQYFMQDKPYNFDSIRAPLSKEFDSLITLSSKNDKYLDDRNRLKYSIKLGKTIDSLDEYVSIERKTNDKLLRYTNLNGTAVSDSLFSEFRKKHNYLHFIREDYSEPIKVNKLVAIRYSLQNDTVIYFIALGLLFIIAMLVSSIIATRDYFKYRSIINQMKRMK